MTNGVSKRNIKIPLNKFFNSNQLNGKTLFKAFAENS